MSETLHKLKIVSNGHANTTKITVDGKNLNFVQKLTVTAEVSRNLTAKMELIAPILEIEGEGVITSSEPAKGVLQALTDALVYLEAHQNELVKDKIKTAIFSITELNALALFEMEAPESSDGAVT